MSENEGKDTSLYSLENQMIYRLASLEATVTNSLRRIDEKIDNFQKDFHHKHTNQVAVTAALSAQLDATKEATNNKIEKVEESMTARLASLESFKQTITAKAMGIASVVTIGWVLLGDLITEALGRTF